MSDAIQEVAREEADIVTDEVLERMASLQARDGGTQFVSQPLVPWCAVTHYWCGG